MDASSSHSTCILLIAHAPLATALKACAVHMLPEYERYIATYDVAPRVNLEDALQCCLAIVKQLKCPQTLIMTDIIGATPYNLSQCLLSALTKGTSDKPIQLVSGINIPMLLRALTYRKKPLDELVGLVIAGGIKGIQVTDTDFSESLF
ncbi:MAG: PTS sugar transporter subunit IIA [Saezia sp.]